jgi:hypothetical protein
MEYLPSSFVSRSQCSGGESVGYGRQQTAVSCKEQKGKDHPGSRSAIEDSARAFGWEGASCSAFLNCILCTLQFLLYASFRCASPVGGLALASHDVLDRRGPGYAQPVQRSCCCRLQTAEGQGPQCAGDSAVGGRSLDAGLDDFTDWRR